MADDAGTGGTLKAYRALLESTKQEILRSIPKVESAVWKLSTVLLPVVLTSILGLVVNTVALKERAKTATQQSAFDAGLDRPIGEFYSSYSTRSIVITSDLPNEDRYHLPHLIQP